jgi:hypothetical protein
MSNFDELFSFTAAEALAEVKKGDYGYLDDYLYFEKDTRPYIAEGVLDTTLTEFWDLFSDVYMSGYFRDRKGYEALVVPILHYTNYFKEYIDREMVYCSVFRNFAIQKTKSRFKIIGLNNNWVYREYVKDEFTCKGNTTVRELLDKIYQIVRQHYIDFFKDYDHCMDGDHGPLLVERTVMFEFIIRNAEKFGIDYYYENDTEVYVPKIIKRWVK